jgi:hypothetical protein
LEDQIREIDPILSPYSIFIIDLQFGSTFTEFGGHIQGGRNLSLLQLVRAHFAREDHHLQQGKRLDLGDLWYSDWNGFWKPISSYSIVLWMNYQPHSLFFYL